MEREELATGYYRFKCAEAPYTRRARVIEVFRRVFETPATELEKAFVPDAGRTNSGSGPQTGAPR